ncbi:MAG TPA: hypothetical protein VMM36_10845 [Opitutaceae bacterium]|nr:hypothetical protein [Opitutaceae bacterium]
MNPNPSLSSTFPATDATCVAARLTAATAVALLGVHLLLTPARAQEAAYDDEDAEVMTRGPVHEAFATVVDYNPGRGLVTQTQPPDPIDELPPEERPEGDDVAWIPGYWAWDDDQSDYIWVSGTWRVPPPGREWVPGYWSDSDGEFIWISGYWAEIETRETTYLPPPPQSLESGPNVDAPSNDYGWTPGTWIWHDARYAWRPGYWERGRGDWIWIPSYYVWTPHGYIFVEGYWDYVIARRGVVYAPVHFSSRVYARRGYHYSPRIVFNLGLFSDHLFVRPRWSHYYFGDYYAPRYESAGFYFSFSYYNSRRGYDPFYSHWRWENRRDRDWERRYQASYRYRRDNEVARPPGTWSAQVAMASSGTTSTQTRIIVAGTTSQVTSTRDYPVKFRRVEENERRTLSTRGQDVRVARDQRRTTESRFASTAGGRSAEISEPRRIERPRSPIASRPQRELPRDLTPPKAPRSPRVDLNAAARTTGRPDRAERPRTEGASQGRQGPTGERQGRAEDNAARARTDAQAIPRSEAETRARNETEAQSNREARQREQPAKANEQNEARQRAAAQRNNDHPSQERRAKEETEPRAERDGQAQIQNESETRARNEAQAQANREAGQREQTAKAKAQSDANAQADAQAQAKRNADARQQREQVAKARAQEEAQGRARADSQARERQEAVQRTGEAQTSERRETAQQPNDERAQRSKQPPPKPQKRLPEEEEESTKGGKGKGRP